MAQWSRDALELRFGTMAGGCLGTVAGFFVFGYIGAVIGGASILLLLPIGLVLGWFLDVRIVLSLMAR